MRKRGQLESIKAIIGILIGIAIVIILFFVGGLVVKMIQPGEDTDLGALAYKVYSLKDGGEGSAEIYINEEEAIIGFDYSDDIAQYKIFKYFKFKRPGEEKHCRLGEVCICRMGIADEPEVVDGSVTPFTIIDCFYVSGVELRGVNYWNGEIKEDDIKGLHIGGESKKIFLNIKREKVEGGRDILEIKPLFK